MSRRARKQSLPKPAPLPTQGNAAASSLWCSKDWLYAGLLLIALLAAYYPALHGTPLWDDDAHLTKPELYSWNGLWRIWFDLGATQQYYPLTHSLFWLQHRLWGDHYTGYHLVNILLHASAAILLVRILRELRIPGAWLAGALWALHPMQVESVAWMSELKNTLSTVCYFSAAWCYLRYERERSWKPWALALVVFFLGLMAKSVIATLPAALLLITWWREGRIQWKKDIQPLLPFFAVGIASGLFTAWVERTLIGANGGNFHFSVWERMLIAGHAFWFYLFKLLWPAKLTFIYPRWEIDAAQWTQWLYPVFAFALVVLLVWKRKQWGRGPLVAVLYFAGTPFPALGFLNIYPFLFSFVADHFQYLACAGPIVLAVAGINYAGKWLEQFPGKAVLNAALPAILGLLTWNQCGMYRDIETLYRTTLAENSEIWLFHYNLGYYYSRQKQPDKAIYEFCAAIRINPGYVEAHNDLGIMLQSQGRFPEAVAQFQEALRIRPAYAEACNNLGLSLQSQGRANEAVTQFQQALQINPEFPEARANYGNALLAAGQIEKAIAQFRAVLRLNPADWNEHNNLGIALCRVGRLHEGIDQFREAVQINPDSANIHNNLGSALRDSGALSDAIAEYRRALQINPESVELRYNLSTTLNSNHQTGEAISVMQEAVRLLPGNVVMENNLAWMLATAEPVTLRDGTRAVQLALHANEASGGKNPAILDTLAAAYAQSGDFTKASQTAHAALALAESQSNTTLATSLRREIQFYESGHSLEATSTQP